MDLINEIKFLINKHLITKSISFIIEIKSEIPESFSTDRKRLK